MMIYLLTRQSKYFRLQRYDEVCQIALLLCVCSLSSLWMLASCSLSALSHPEHCCPFVAYSIAEFLGLSLVQGSLVLRMPKPSQTALSDIRLGCTEQGSPAPNWVPEILLLKMQQKGSSAMSIPFRIGIGVLCSTFWVDFRAIWT